MAPAQVHDHIISLNTTVADSFIKFVHACLFSKESQTLQDANDNSLVQNVIPLQDSVIIQVLVPDVLATLLIVEVAQLSINEALFIVPLKFSE